MENTFTPLTYWLLSLFIWASAASCTVSTPSYSTATAGQEIAYMAKPISQDTVKSATYVSGAVGFGAFYQVDDKNVAGETSLHQSHTFKYGNIAYGAHGFLGSYRVTDMGNLTGRKNFHGYGFRASANLNVPFAYSDWRVIGVEGAFTREAGSYRSFRKEAAVNGQLIDVHPDKSYSVVGLRSEYIKEVLGNEDFRLGLSAGYFWILENESRMILFAPYLEYKKLGISMLVSGGDDAGSTVLRLNYRL